MEHPPINASEATQKATRSSNPVAKGKRLILCGQTILPSKVAHQVAPDLPCLGPSLRGSIYGGFIQMFSIMDLAKEKAWECRFSHVLLSWNRAEHGVKLRHHCIIEILFRAWGYILGLPNPVTAGKESFFEANPINLHHPLLPVFRQGPIHIICMYLEPKWPLLLLERALFWRVEAQK